MAIYRRQRIILRQTIVEEAEVMVLVPLFASKEEQLKRAIEASGLGPVWRPVTGQIEISDWYTIDQVDLEVPDDQ